MLKKKKTSKKKKKISTFSRTWRIISFEWCELDVSSKFVLLIGFAFLFELYFSIFVFNAANETIMHGVFRTGLAGFMGYLLGGVSVTKTPPPGETPASEPAPIMVVETAPPMPINKNPKKSDCEFNSLALHNSNLLRTCLIGLICIFSIVILVTATYSGATDYKEGLAQLRTNISTAFGFLLTRSSQKSGDINR